MKLIPHFLPSNRISKRAARRPAPAGRSAALAKSQARATLLCAAACTVAILAGWNFVSDAFHPEWRDPAYGHRLQSLRAAVVRVGKPLIVCTGSSRTLNALCSEEFDKQDDCLLVNWGFGGELPARQLLAYRRLKADGIPIRGMLIEVLPAAMMAAEPIRTQLNPHKMRFRDLYLMRDQRDGLPDPETIATRLDPVSDTRLVILERSAPGLLSNESRWRVLAARAVHPLGWSAFGEKILDGPGRLRQRELMRATYEGAYRLETLLADSTRALEKLLDECRADGVPADIFITPEDGMFRSFYSPGFRKAFEDYLADLRARYGVAVMDFRDALPDDAFVDGHHVLENPARRFTSDHFLPAALAWWRGQSGAGSVK